MRTFIAVIFTLYVVVIIVDLLRLAYTDFPEARKPKERSNVVLELVLQLALAIWAAYLLFV